MPPTIVVEVLNTHHMIMTFFHFPAPGMGSLLRDSFGKEVGKRKWCETFAGPLVRRLSRSGGLSFIFSTEMLFFCAFFWCFSGAPEHKKKEKNTQFIPQKNKIHTTKKNTKKHKSYHKKTQFISQKKHKKNTNHTRKNTQQQKNTIHTTKKTKNKVIFLFVSASVSAFFLLLFFFFCFFSSFFLLLDSPARPSSSPSASQPPRPLVPRPPAPRLSPQALPRPSPAAPAFYMYCTHTVYCFAIGAAMGNILNPKQHCFAIGIVVSSILNPKQYCLAISAAMCSILNPKQYCLAISAAMGSILNPKQYCFAISDITTHKVLTSWMHEAFHWKFQCRILTARNSGHGKKMCRPWSQLAGNMTGHLALIRGN